MAKYNQEHLNTILFEQLMNLQSEDMTQEKISFERERTMAISDMARNIISNNALTLKVAKFKIDDMPNNQELPENIKVNLEK